MRYTSTSRTLHRQHKQQQQFMYNSTLKRQPPSPHGTSIYRDVPVHVHNTNPERSCPGHTIRISYLWHLCLLHPCMGTLTRRRGDGLDRRLPARLVREQQRERPAPNDERARHVHRHSGLEVRVQRDDRALRYTAHARCIACQTTAGSDSGERERTMMPKTRVAVAVRPLPVPRSLAGNTSGEIAYRTPYMICLSRGVSDCTSPQ